MRRGLLGGALAISLGCGSPTASNDGAGGNSGAEPCAWCADVAPFARSCATTMIASGGQLVCVDDGEARLCQPPTACAPNARDRPRTWATD